MNPNPNPNPSPSPNPNPNPNPNQAMRQASIMTRGGIVQPIQYLVGMAMVARGEFAFLVAYSAR